MPRGLYVRDSSPAARGEFVLAWLPSVAREMAHARGYLPRTVPALKPIAAIAGDVVCATGVSITINGSTIAERRTEDHQGREMPTWTGCKTLSRDQIFLLSTYAPDSFDGRYFGLSVTSDIIEKVTPVWTFP
jgi:conjugative transfer signal peptidase TraF